MQSKGLLLSSKNAIRRLADMTEQDQGLRKFCGYNIKRAFNVIQADVNQTLTRFGLRLVTWSALSVIKENPGLRQSQLADILSIERPNLVLLLDELERADLINRDRDSADRRAYCLSLTETGEVLYAEALLAVEAHEDRMTEGLTAEERVALIAMLRRIEANGKTGGETDGTGSLSEA